MTRRRLMNELTAGEYEEWKLLARVEADERAQKAPAGKRRGGG